MRSLRRLVGALVLISVVACGDEGRTGGEAAAAEVRAEATSDVAQDLDEPGDVAQGLDEPGCVDALDVPATDADAGPPGCLADTWPPCVTATPSELSFDLFTVPGARFWLEVRDEQSRAMNVNLRAEWDPRGPDDVYTLPDDGEATPSGMDDGTVTFADRLVVRVPGLGAADFGKVEVRLAGTTTRRPLVRDGVPNLRFDADEFQEDLRVGGVEHFRLNNGVTGSLFREHLAAEVHRALGYPAPRTTFAFLGSTVHGEGVWLPMVLSEVYKRGFCEANAPIVGGGCAALWKFDGDLGCDGTTPCAMADAEDCVAGDCDLGALTAFGDAIRAAPEGEGFKQALAPWLDWQLFHRFQCLGLVVATIDDALRNMGNNTVLAQRADDGRFVFLPYSLDISALGVPVAGYGSDSGLRGNIVLARKCQADPQCWHDAQLTCRAVVEELRAAHPEALVDAALATLRAHGMMRPGDEERATALRAWYAGRADALNTILDAEGP